MSTTDLGRKMNKSELINQLSLSNNEKIKEVLDKIYNYHTLSFNQNLFFNSTATYDLDFLNPLADKNESWNEPLLLKQLFPDFILDNCTTQRKEESKLLVDFVKVFLPQILSMDLFFSIKRKQYLYLNPIKEFQFSLKTINNKKNLESLMRRFFSSKITVIENVPQKIPSSAKFTLGQSQINSKLSKNSQSIGNHVYSIQNKYYVLINIKEEELKKIEEFCEIYAKKKFTVLKFFENKNRKYLYRFTFLGTELKSINFLKRGDNL